MGIHVLSLRLPDELHGAARAVARKRGISFSALVQEQLRRAIDEDLDRAMREAAEMLARYPGECDVSYADEAQGEQALRIPYDA